MCYCNCKYENPVTGDGCKKPAHIPYPCVPLECDKCGEEFSIDEMENNYCPHCGFEYGI